MSAIVGWALAVVGVAVGYVQWGWRGVVLAVTVIVFWLLLQFSRAMRAMSKAGARPIGSVASAVMLNAKLSPGMRLLDILPLTGSLGEKVSDTPETFVWTDESGASVRVELAKGRCTTWQLSRAAEPSPDT